MQSNRNLSIDLCRVLGLFGVILAHTNISEFTFNFRQFDVTMLIFVSAMSFTYGNPINSFKDYFNYCYKRFKRLIVPVWIFLFFYFISDLVCGIKPNVNTIISSFLLLNGIGYVWIFRILFICSLINPLIEMVLRKSNGHCKQIVWIFVVIWLIYEIGYQGLINVLPNALFTIINYSLLYTVGFGLISYLGLIYRRLSNWQKRHLFIFFELFIVIFVFFNESFNLQDFKYPPRSIYLFYGLGITFLCLNIFDKFKWNNLMLLKSICWLSKNSFTIYFTHIIVLKYLTGNDLLNLRLIQPIWVISVSILISMVYLNLKGVGFRGKNSPNSYPNL